MKLQVLGCSGGMGLGHYTSCYRINSSILLDAGTGLARLDLAQQLQIKQVFLTHAHLDHICCLPLLIDNVFEQLQDPIQVYAVPEVLATVQEHIFNWNIWPDFSRLTNSVTQALEFKPLALNQPVVSGSLSIQPFVAQHVVPACGLQVIQGAKSLAYTGDTTLGTEVIAALNQLGQLDLLLVECAFPNRLTDLARKSKHLTPGLIAEFVGQLQQPPKRLGLTHFKLGYAAEITAELNQLSLPGQVILLDNTIELEI